MLESVRTAMASLGGHATADSADATRGRAVGRSGGVRGNERLTSSLALLLLVLLPIEAATTIALGTLRPEGYRRKGAPALLLRLLAPLLVLSTITPIGSGVALVLGDARGGLVLTVH